MINSTQNPSFTLSATIPSGTGSDKADFADKLTDLINSCASGWMESRSLASLDPSRLLSISVEYGAEMVSLHVRSKPGAIALLAPEDNFQNPKTIISFLASRGQSPTAFQRLVFRALVALVPAQSAAVAMSRFRERSFVVEQRRCLLEISGICASALAQGNQPSSPTPKGP